MPAHVHFLGGHADGSTLAFDQTPTVYDVPTKPGDRHPAGRAFTRYHHSEAWSQRFKQPVMIPENFPGLPPKRELQTA